MDKSVENVENSQLSTGNPAVYTEASGGRENGRFVPREEEDFPGRREGGGSKPVFSSVKKLVLMVKQLTKGSRGFWGLPKICG